MSKTSSKRLQTQRSGTLSTKEHAAAFHAVKQMGRKVKKFEARKLGRFGAASAVRSISVDEYLASQPKETGK